MSKFGKLDCYQTTNEEEAAIKTLFFVTNFCKGSIETYWTESEIKNLKEEFTKKRINDPELKSRNLEQYLVQARFESFKNGVKANFIQQCENQIPLCFYCEEPLVIPDGKVRNFDLDHIANKSRYPEFTYEPFNLVPACENCNRRCKGDKDVLSKKNCTPEDSIYLIVHPYIDSKKEMLKKNKDLPIWEILIPEENQIKKESTTKKRDILLTKRRKAEKTIEIFKLNESITVEEMIKKYMKKSIPRKKVSDEELDELDEFIELYDLTRSKNAPLRTE